jgi:hypothetical protein
VPGHSKTEEEGEDTLREWIKNVQREKRNNLKDEEIQANKFSRKEKKERNMKEEDERNNERRGTEEQNENFISVIK